MDRRKFLKQSVLTTGAVALPTFPHQLLAERETKHAHDLVTLGDTGIQVTRLAMGTGTSGVSGSSNQTRKLGLSGLADLLYYAYDRGVIFWDSADQYGTHPHLKEALEYVPREDVVILTKTHASTGEEMRADLDRFRREIGTDYLDIVLLHLMTSKHWNKQKRGAMDVLSEAREEGIVRAHGVSCHTLPALKTAAESPWVQVDLARINPAGVRMDSDVPTVVSVLEKMKKEGKGVIGMKVFGAGRLTDRIDESLKFVMGLGCVDSFTIGMISREQFDDTRNRIRKASQ